ncbi:MAG: ABC transporter permease [Alphaproteobacteria bacterium]
MSTTLNDISRSSQSEGQLPVLPPEAPRPRFAPGKTPIVPPGSVTGRSLTMVIVIMAFMACLTWGMVYMINKRAATWRMEMASEITALVGGNPTSKEIENQAEWNATVARQARQVEEFLNSQKGILKAELMSLKETAHFAEAWMGQISDVEKWPFPRLITIKIDQSSPPDFATLREALAANFPSATLDDHRVWQKQLRRVTGSLAFGGIVLILLVAAATVGIIGSAARSAMASNRDIVEVLNFVGADERFIARQFEMHFLKLGVKAGVVGALAAGSVFFFLPILADFMSNAATRTELHRLVGDVRLDWLGYSSLLLVVVAIAAICLITSRFGVRNILNMQNP